METSSYRTKCQISGTSAAWPLSRMLMKERRVLECRHSDIPVRVYEEIKEKSYD
jgi:hypothetical protein